MKDHTKFKDLAQTATYHGSGWREREYSLGEEIRMGELWSPQTAGMEWDRLQSVLLFVPSEDWQYEGDPNDIQHIGKLRYPVLHSQLLELKATFERLMINVELVPTAFLKDTEHNLVFMRDTFFMTNEGAIIARMGSGVRAGEELPVAHCLASLGVPIIKSIGGSGTFEGADALWVRNDLVLLGVGKRTNIEGAKQVQDVLRAQGVDTCFIELPAGIQHLLGIVQIVDSHKVIIRQNYITQQLKSIFAQLDFSIIELEEQDEVYRRQAMNFVAIGPSEIVMAANNPVTRKVIEDHGISVAAEVDISELTQAAGGIACATGILSREKSFAPYHNCENIGSYTISSYRPSEGLTIGWQQLWTIQEQLLWGLTSLELHNRGQLEIHPLAFEYGIPMVEFARNQSLDIAFLGDLPAIKLLNTSDDYRIVSRLMDTTGVLYVPKNSPYQHLEDLSGATVAGLVGSSSEHALFNCGTVANPVRMTMHEQWKLAHEYPSSSRWRDFDAFFGFEPIPSALVSRGFARKLKVADSFGFVVAHRKVIEERGDILEHFLNSLQSSWYSFTLSPDRFNRNVGGHKNLIFDKKVLMRNASFDDNFFANDRRDISLRLENRHLHRLESCTEFLLSRGEIKSSSSISDYLAPMESRHLGFSNEGNRALLSFVEAMERYEHEKITAIVPHSREILLQLIEQVGSIDISIGAIDPGRLADQLRSSDQSQDYYHYVPDRACSVSESEEWLDTLAETFKTEPGDIKIITQDFQCALLLADVICVVDERGDFNSYHLGKETRADSSYCYSSSYQRHFSRVRALMSSPHQRYKYLEH